MKFFSRSSLATGPKIRVPLGVKSSLISTAAFSSNLMYEPSALLNPCFVLTMTALTTSPFLTPPLFQNNAGFKQYIVDQVNAYNLGYYTNGTNTEYFPAGNVAMFNEGPWWASMQYGPNFNNSELTVVNASLHVTQDDVDNYSTPYKERGSEHAGQ